jgi:hypothetical protein
LLSAYFADAGKTGSLPILDMLEVFAEFETNLRRERQLEGIAKAKATGVYKGRPPSIEAARVRKLKAQGTRPVDIAQALKIGRGSVYRVLPSRTVTNRPDCRRLQHVATGDMLLVPAVHHGLGVSPRRLVICFLVRDAARRLLLSIGWPAALGTCRTLSARCWGMPAWWSLIAEVAAIAH